MTTSQKRESSYVVNSVLASTALYWVFDLSSSGRTVIDWVVIGLAIAAVAWNVVQLSRKLRVLGGTAVWHVQRTVLFWILGMMNTVFRAPGEEATWKYVIGMVLLALAAVDTFALWRKERRVREFTKRQSQAAA